MRQIIRAYLDEIVELSKKVIDNDNKIEAEDLSEIINMMNEYSKKLFTDVKTNNKEVLGKYTDILLKCEILYNLLDEEGYSITNNSISEITDNKWKTEAKNRLFMMFIKRLSAINYLLKGGYSSAALALTRGVYEISVYFEIILNNNEEIAKKFLQYCNVDSLKLAKALSAKKREKEIKHMINEFNYGNEYVKEYGWAKSLINGDITFRKLANKTELSKVYFMYTYCCSAVHASVIDSIGGVGTSEEDRGKSVWMTGSAEEGIPIVIGVLSSFSGLIIQKYLNNKSLTTLLIVNILSDICHEIKE